MLNSTFSNSECNIESHPFADATKICFTLFEKTDVKLEIFQINGTKVTSLVNQLLPQGDYTMVWKPEYVNSQTYIAVLAVGNKRRAIKIQQSPP